MGELLHLLHVLQVVLLQVPHPVLRAPPGGVLGAGVRRADVLPRVVLHALDEALRHRVSAHAEGVQRLYAVLRQAVLRGHGLPL